jgi:hypothetical protein
VRRSALPLLALLVASSLATSVAAQEPADRAAIDAFRDTLGALTSASQLLPIVAREKNARPASDKELGRLRYGWSLIRLGQLSDSAPPLIDATLQFYEATVRRSKWPYAWFGLGATKLALDGIGATEVRSEHQPAGSGWRWGAANAFLSTVRSDTTYITAAVELGLTVMRTPTWTNIPPVIEAMTRAAKSGHAGDGVWLVLGRLQRQIDSNRAALKSFDTFAAIQGVDQGVAQLERARTLFALGENAEAEKAYFAGAMNPTDSARALYRKDASWIQDSSAMQVFDTVAGGAFPAYLAKIWRDRETASGRAAGSRLAEHYRRWDVAQRKYKSMPALRRQWDFGQIYRSAQTDLDDRGVIYMRHGEPDDRAFFVADGIPPNESWVYHRPTGDLVLHFSASFGSSGWHMIEGLGSLEGNPCQVAALLDSRAMIDPYYQVLADMARMDSIKIAFAAKQGDNTAVEFMRACSPGQLTAGQARAAVIGIAAGGISTNWFGSQRANQERLASRTAIQRSTTTDSDPLRYRAPLQPIVQAYGVGGTQPGVGKLLVLWALPASDRPRADTVPGVTGIVYSIRVRANVFDTLGNLVVGIDSVRRYRAPALLQPGTSLPGLLQIEVPAGIYRIQLSVADTIGDKGAARVLGGIPVPSFTGPFELSDLVLGIEGNGPFWVRNPTSRFPLNPRNAWTNTESMEVGFELAGLPAGTAYKTRIAVADLGADSTRPPRASVEFDNQASGTRELVSQSLGLRSLRPGVYLLTVTVTAGDRSIKRERRVTIAAAR